MFEHLKQYQLNEDRIASLLSDLYTNGADFADLYFQHSISESWSLSDGIIKQGTYDIEQGVGVRATQGEKSLFSYADGWQVNDINQAISFVREAGKKRATPDIKSFGSHNHLIKYNSLNPLDSLTTIEKIALLNDIDKLARADKRVKEVKASLVGNYTTVVVAASDGTLVEDLRPMVRLNVTVVVQENNNTEMTSSGGGGRYDYRYFVDHQLGEQYTKEALRQADISLQTKPAPAGTMPVILAPGWPGVLLHEAVGHGLEGDFNRKGTSVFSGKLGQKVASELCTVVDNGTLANRRGSLNVDDEGTATQNTTLIENGILKGYMHDKLSARLMNMEPTGNGRRESYAYLPMPRMTNTYMLNGTSTLNEMIATVERGIYAVSFGGGQVDITSGKFVFSTTEAYLIENGEVKHPIRDATLIGSGDEVMHNVEMVGNDCRLDSGVGVCGKEGQSVPVGVGQPSLKISSLTVGGTEV